MVMMNESSSVGARIWNIAVTSYAVEMSSKSRQILSAPPPPEDRLLIGSGRT